jgi:hypothetical protein
MSGFGAPARTATPTPDLARSTQLPGTIAGFDELVDRRAGHDDQIVGFARGKPLQRIERSVNVVVTVWRDVSNLPDPLAWASAPPRPLPQ